MLNLQTLLVAGFLLPALSTSAGSYVYPGNPECPWEKPQNKWANYINREFPAPKEPYFSIRLTRDIGDLEGGQCYTIIYRGGENWNGGGKIRTIKQHTSKSEDRHGGDPLKYQMNIWGAMFTYNEAGEVFLAQDGQLAGNLYCHIGSECWK